MKNTFLLFSVLLILFAGCKKDDEEENNEPSQMVSVDGIQYPLTKGYSLNGRIYLMSDGLSIGGVEQSTGNPIYEGTGNLVSLLSIAGQPTITTGSYDLSLVAGEILINYNPALTTFDFYQVINQGTGTCDLTINGLNVTVSINGTMDLGAAVIVAFSGTLTEYTE
jgi:hypothetical protein